MVGAIDLRDIESLGLRFQSGGGWTNGDTWKVDLFEVAYLGTDASGRSKHGLVVERQGRPFRVMNNNQTSFGVPPGTQRPIDPGLTGTRVARIRVRATVGADGGGERVDLVVVRHDGRPDIRENFRTLAGAEGAWQNPGDVAEATLELGAYQLDYNNIAGIYLEGFSDRALGGDLWQELDVATARVDFEDAAGTSYELADFESEDKRGYPTFRFSNPFSSGVLWQGLPEAIAPTTLLRDLGVYLQTGQDDLNANSAVVLVLALADGSVREVPALAAGVGIRGGEEQWIRRLHLDPPIAAGDVVAVSVRFTSGRDPHPDNWNIDRFGVFAQTDPFATWVEELEEAVAELGVGAESPLAFGTDLNGFEVQLPYTEATDIPQDLDALPAPFVIPRASTTGTRTFTLEKDGLAHVGLLPNFVDRIVRTASTDASTAILDSAQRAVSTWRRAEEASGEVESGVTHDPLPPTHECRAAD
jgi:hypothetical protein